MEEGAAVRSVSVKRIAKFFLWLFAAIAGLMVVLVVLVSVADIIRWHGFRRGFLDDPSMKLYPKPLADNSLAKAKGITTVTQSGCSIDLPWPNVTVTQEHYLATLPDGRSTFFTDPATTTDEAAIHRWAFGDSTFQSNYDYVAAQLNFNPAELTELPWGRRHQQQISLAIEKSGTHGPIYSVTLDNVRGFQFGDANQTHVELRMFDPKDRQFRVNIRAGKSRVSWTQPEINFIIHSMRCDAATYSARRQAWDSKLREHR